MREQFRSTNFRSESLLRIEQMNSIIEEYQDQGLRLTARQLFYQFVSRDLIPNLPAEYKKLTALLTDARYAGMVDWDAIEDRGREPSSPNEWVSLQDRIDGALANYRLPRWRDQPYYAELWVEKQALAGVLQPLSRAHHVTLMVNKGYSSSSSMKESAERIMRACEDDDKECYIFYLGDHDPSGEDMVRDIRTRLEEFGVHRLTVEKVGLTTAQVKQYKPPPNPAKLTDPRAKAYIEEHGPKSWEVDALPPNVLTRLIENAFSSIIDQEKLQAVLAEEERDKALLTKAVASLRKKKHA